MATTFVYNVRERLAGVFVLHGAGFERADFLCDGALIDTVILHPKLQYQSIPFISNNTLRLDLVDESARVKIMVHGELCLKNIGYISFVHEEIRDLDFHVNTYLRQTKQYMIIYKNGTIKTQQFNDFQSSDYRLKCAL